MVLGVLIGSTVTYEMVPQNCLSVISLNVRVKYALIGVVAETLKVAFFRILKNGVI